MRMVDSYLAEPTHGPSLPTLAQICRPRNHGELGKQQNNLYDNFVSSPDFMLGMHDCAVSPATVGTSRIV